MNRTPGSPPIHPLQPEHLTKTVTATVRRRLRRRLERLAEAKGLTLPALIRDALQRYLHIDPINPEEASFPA